LGKFICFKCVDDSDELNAASDADTYAETVRLGSDSDAGSQADTSRDDSTIDAASDDSILQEIESIHDDIEWLKQQVQTLTWSQGIHDLFNLLKPQIAEEIRDGVAAAISAEMDKNAPTTVQGDKKLDVVVEEDGFGDEVVGYFDPDKDKPLDVLEDKVKELSEMVKSVYDSRTQYEPKGAYMLLLREMRDEVRKQVRADLVDEMHDDIQQMQKTMQSLRDFVSLQTEWRENLQSQMSALLAVLQDLTDFKDAYKAKKDRPFRKRLFGLKANAADLPALLARLDAS